MKFCETACLLQLQNPANACCRVRGFPIVSGRLLRKPPPCGLILVPIFKLKYLSDYSELSKILPDLEFSDNFKHEISRVLAETFSARRNLCSKLETWLRIFWSPKAKIQKNGDIRILRVLYVFLQNTCSVCENVCVWCVTFFAKHV